MRFDYALVQNIHDPATIFLFLDARVKSFSLVTMKLHYYKLCFTAISATMDVDARCYCSVTSEVSNIITLLVIYRTAI